MRFLFDAGILPQVTHITAVSGGSIFAAHLCLNWERYTREAAEFDAAAAELLAFIRMDVRNRILRRFPLALALRPLRRVAGRSNRKLTRTGLLEYHYQRYLYGDTSLFQLPQKPQLHMLATNVSEGALTSFNCEGLWTIRRDEGRGFRVDRMHIGLATVPMAVAASSAFPGFFPPMTLTGDDVGAKSGVFGRQSYTDGGVFDNLGVRMFHFLGKSGAEERPWDAVLVSDVGKPFQVEASGSAGGMVRTAMRASDILMDRVWQLESETFAHASGFLFARFTDVVEPKDDPTALHPELQRQLASIRTDLDRFSPLEITSLVRHGYCIGRQACRTLPQVFGAELPANPPWTPAIDGATTPSEPAFDHRAAGEASEITKAARTLHASGVRRIWSTLLDYRDWTSYVYVPLIVPILVLAPYFSVKYFEYTHRMNQIVQSLAQGSRDLEQMSRLIDGPVAPFTGEKPEPMAEGRLDLRGFTILQDLRMIDLRRWQGTSPYIYGYRRLKVRRDLDVLLQSDFATKVLAESRNTQVRFPEQPLKPRLYSRETGASLDAEKLLHWEVRADFGRVPVGDAVDIVYEHMSPGRFLRSGIGSASLAFDVEAKTIELTRWLLMPEGREYKSFQIVRYETGRRDVAEHVNVVTQYLAEDKTILAFKLLALDPGYTYELTWFYE